MSTGEKAITQKIMKWLREQGYWVMKIHGSSYQLPGVPDILAVKDGRAVWVEVKRPGNTPTAIQIVRLRELRAHGCRAFVAFSLDDVKAEIANEELE